jgi:hypothetical protein
MNTLEQLFRAPLPAERPIRVLVYGFSKSGKSHLVKTAAEVGPLYWIDTERGSDFYPSNIGHGFTVMYDRDPLAALKAVKLAHKMAETSDVKPVVAIDSMSSIWFEQQEVAQRLTNERGGDKNRRASFRSWADAKAPLKQLYEMFHWALCHIIITARAKEEYVVNSRGEPTAIGTKPDIERNLPYSMDLILEMTVNSKKGQKPKPTDFVATIRGTRTSPDIQEMAIGSVFKDPKFSDFLVARLEGEAPTPIGSTAEEQINLALDAPLSYSELVARVKELGWDPQQATALLKREFGDFSGDMLPYYWSYIKEQNPDEHRAREDNREAGEKAGGGDNQKDPGHTPEV